VGHIDVINQDLAAVRVDQPDNHIKTGGFAGAVRAQQSNYLPTVHSQRDVSDNLPALVAFCQMMRVKSVHH
jgi:hypothetical protein